jgi:hypothetical protein
MLRAQVVEESIETGDVFDLGDADAVGRVGAVPGGLRPDIEILPVPVDAGIAEMILETRLGDALPGFGICRDSRGRCRGCRRWAAGRTSRNAACGGRCRDRPPRARSRGGSACSRRARLHPRGFKPIEGRSADWATSRRAGATRANCCRRWCRAWALSSPYQPASTQ